MGGQGRDFCCIHPEVKVPGTDHLEFGKQVTSYRASVASCNFKGNDAPMATLQVKGLPEHEWGKSRIRINCMHRGNKKRYCLLKIANRSNDRSCLAIVSGHSDKDGIYMDFDTRNEQGIGKKQKLDFDISDINWMQKIIWYMRFPDPMIRIPAWLALWSVVLGAAGMFIGIWSLAK